MINKLVEAKMGPGPKKTIKSVTVATPDSTGYFKKLGYQAARDMGSATNTRDLTLASNRIAKADKNMARQKMKGKPGYDKNGFPLKKI